MPSAASDLASSSRAGARETTSTASSSRSIPSAPSSSPSTRSERATVPGAPQSRARSSSSEASSIALRFMPSWSSATARSELQRAAAGLW